MKILAILKYLIAQEATTMTKIAERLLVEKNRNLSMNNLSRKLRTETIKYVEVAEIADLLGYDIKFVKRK
ncbi:TPA: LLM class flavin-dependent oxidoreductase [Candidatus Scatousia excrementigallinarum]|uniref:LLM class flavin-dependent oxidoreductase n=1 Tax=Candidatus Scatousia excrementigallinarum TaxID=2840935 RepID=A0A9D1F0J4_9BACT|nr:LLM class flavin-dependent oxidoreductase [Candidatus Scatousia excrementigallinarum]